MTVWDPLRKKEVPLTPEEKVRQWFIGVLSGPMQVPLHKMMSEVGLKYGEGPVRKEFRADIVVYGRDAAPLMVVECKRPQVALTPAVWEQALRYDRVLTVRYIALTNGTRTLLARRGEDGFVFLDTVPVYGDMQ